MYKRVLLPISGKKQGNEAMSALARALQVSNGEFILLHVCRPVAQIADGENREAIRQEEEARSMMLMGSAIEYLRNSGRKFYTRVVEGTPAETIVGVADEENADLIVMFSDGRDSLGDMIRGSITERVLRNTMRDLLVVRL